MIGTVSVGRAFSQALYELNNTWLRPNSGRGEHMPIFVLEDHGLRAPEGRVTRLVPPNDSAGASSTRTEPVDQHGWLEAITGSRSDVLLAELHVPPR